MADPVFFVRPAPLSIGAIAGLTGARLPPGAPLDRPINGVAALETAGAGDATFIETRRYLGALAGTAAGACFCTRRDAGLVPERTVALEVARPQEAFARLAAAFYPSALGPAPVYGAAGISPAAHVHPDARLEDGVTVEPGAVIGPRAEIGRGSLIGATAVIGPDVRIGRDTSVSAGAVITNALIGNRVIIHPGACIGQDGFGYVAGEAGHRKIPQIGRVIIQDDVEIGANTTVDRGSVRDTIIGEGTKIDNLVQIAHNVVIGRHCFLAGMVGISGSVTIGDFVGFGGGVGVAPHVKIGDRVEIVARSGVSRNIPAGEQWAGSPAGPLAEWRRSTMALRHAGRLKAGSDAAGEPNAEEGETGEKGT